MNIFLRAAVIYLFICSIVPSNDGWAACFQYTKIPKPFQLSTFTFFPSVLSLTFSRAAVFIFFSFIHLFTSFCPFFVFLFHLVHTHTHIHQRVWYPNEHARSFLIEFNVEYVYPYEQISNECHMLTRIQFDLACF